MTTTTQKNAIGNTPNQANQSRSEQGTYSQDQKGQTGSAAGTQDRNAGRSTENQKEGDKSSQMGGGMKNDAVTNENRREREEEDRPRAENKVGNR
jgi:hypothetical protein